jgi:hypothetical protein
MLRVTFSHFFLKRSGQENFRNRNPQAVVVQRQWHAISTHGTKAVSAEIANMVWLPPHPAVDFGGSGFGS